MDKPLFLYYFRDCPTCKNHNRNLVRECSLQTQTSLDERYILALPDIWGEEADLLSADGAKVPFLLSPKTKKWLNIDYEKEGMKEEILNFFKEL